MAFVRVMSELPATVWKVFVEAGQTVAEDETLLILESMKMEIPLLSPDAGTVVRLFVAEGDTVAEGQVVLELEI